MITDKFFELSRQTGAGMGEQFLQESEERYRTILENIQDGYFECDLTGRIIFCNDSFCRIHGYSREACHSTDYRDYLTPENAQRTFQAFRHVYLTGKPLPSFEIEVINPEGHVRYLDESVSLIRDAQGSVCGFRGIVRDTTERRKAEDQMRKLEERFRTIANNVPVMIRMSEPDKACSFFNQHWLNFTGRTLEQEIGDRWTENIHPDDLERMLGISTSSFHARVPFKMEFRMRRHDGVYRWVLDEGVPRYLSNGEFTGFIGGSIDITDRRETEEALRQSEERYRTILETINDGYFETNLAGQLTFVNDGLVRMFGHKSKNELVGLKLNKFTEEPHITRLRKLANATYHSSKQVPSFVYELNRLDGLKCDVDMSLSLIEDNTGQPTGFRGIIRDVTLRRRSETLIEGQVKVLEMIATGAPLTETLEAVVHLVEELFKNEIGSILLLDEEGKRLRHGAALSMREEYVRAIDGLTIGSCTGSCGTAAYTRQTVIVADIANDPLWVKFRDLALSHDLRACWSVPIFSVKQQVLGTFAVYSRTVSVPNPEDVKLIETLANLASIAIERSRSEGQLQASEARFRALTEKSAEGISLLLPDTTLIYTSPATKQITGYDPGDVVGTKVEIRIHPEDLPHFKGLIASLSQMAGSSAELSYRSQHKDGSWHWMEGTITNLLEEPGVQAIALNYRDISERKQAEDALRVSEERHRSLIAVLEEGIIVQDDMASILDANASAERILGRTLDQMMGRDSYDPGWRAIRKDGSPFPGEEHPGPITLQTGKSCSNVVMGLSKPDGTVVWVSINSQPLLHPGETKPYAVVCSFSDITQRKQVEDDLRTSEGRYRSLVTALDEGIVMQDEKAVILAANASAERILGLTSDQLRGRTSYDPSWRAIDENGEPFPGEKHPVPVSLRTGKPCSDVIMGVYRPDSSLAWISINAQPLIREGETKPYAAVCSFSDITQRKLTEDSLRASEERFAKAFNASPQPMAILELPSRRYTNVNEALVENSGWTIEEMIGRTPGELNVWANPEDARQVTELFAEHRAIRNLETKFRTKAGEIRDFLYSAEEIVFDGRPHILIVANDITERNRAEDALRQNEALLRSIIESNPDWIFVKDLDHRYRLVNQSYADALHLRAEDFVGKNDLEVGFPDEQVKGNSQKGIAGFWAGDREVFLTGQMTSIKQEPVEVDGQTRVFNTFKVPLFDVGGKVWGVLGVGRDITELKQAEAALRDSEERFAKAFNASPQPMVIFEATGRHIVSVNEAMGRNFGWQADEMLGKTPADLNFWVDMEQQHHVRALLAEQGFVRDLEIQFRTKSGEVREFLYSAETVSLKDLPHVLVVVSDVTERLRTERALQESEERYRLLFEHGFAGISRSTINGRTLDCNDAAAKVFGYESREELLQVNIEDLYFDNKQRKYLIDELQKHGSVRNYERLMKRKDGSPVWTLTNITLLDTEEGKEPVVEGVLLDITERKLIEQELAQSYKQLQSLSARVEKVREEERTRIAREIHDNLGQALTGLKMDFSWLEKHLSRTTDEMLHGKAIPKLKEIAQLLEETIQTVRDIATELRPGLLDTLGLCAAIDWQAQAFGQRSGIKCKTTLCNEPQKLQVDRSTALYRIFQEILTNIARHSKAKQFSVKVAEVGSDLVLTVRDDGIGITEEQLRDPKSLGLIGMRERVLAFGGSLQINGGPRKGTTITVIMPAYGRSEQEFLATE